MPIGLIAGRYHLTLYRLIGDMADLVKMLFFSESYHVFLRFMLTTDEGPLDAACFLVNESRMRLDSQLDGL